MWIAKNTIKFRWNKLFFGFCLATVSMLAFTPAMAQTTGSDVLRMMYKRYAGKWQSSIAFDQTTDMYRNDTLKRSQQWYEVMLFPDKLRIDLTPLEKHNTYIFRSDSTYIIRNGKLTEANRPGNDLIFLLGGLYFMPLDSAIAKMQALGYDITRSYSDTWKGKPAYVIGVSGKTDTANQVWIDKENLFLVRMIKFEGKFKEEGIFDNHIKMGGGWTETRATFYFNGKLGQVETYHNCHAAENLDQRIFDPHNYISIQH